AIGADTGRNYLSKFYDDAWLAENKLTASEQPAFSVGDLLRTRGERDLTTVSPSATAAAAIELMQAKGISQLPVLDNGKPVGSVRGVALARVLPAPRAPGHVAVGAIMARPLPTVDVRVHLDEAYRLLLAGHTGVLAVHDGKVVDIVTRIDLIQYW